jgi:hypothetical protein
MNVETSQATTSKLQGNILQSTANGSTPIGAVSATGVEASAADATDDDMIEVAYHEIRRSVSPQVAEYIFTSRENESSAKSNLAGAGWTFDRILNISVTESELRKLSKESVDILVDLGSNLWYFGERYLNCCAHIAEVLLARESLVGSRTEGVNNWTKILALAYLSMNRMAECETLLMSIIAEIDSHHPGDPTRNQFRSLLGLVHSRQGKHVLAEESCTQALMSQKSTLGLTHKATWSAYGDLCYVLKNTGRYGDSRRLMTKFYTDVYRTVSPQVLPGLIFLLKLCERYIEEWMAESELQRLVRDRFVDDSSLGISERMALTLVALIVEKWRGDVDSGIFPQRLRELEDMTGLAVADALSIFAMSIAWRIQPVRHLESILLRQEALRVVKDLKSTKFLAPLWIFFCFNARHLWKTESYRREAERDLIHSLEKVVNDTEPPPERRNLQLSDGAGDPKSTPVMTNGHAIPRFGPPDSSDSSDSSIRATTASAQAPSTEISPHAVGFDIGTPMPTAVFSATFFQPIPELSSAYSLPAWNGEPYPLQPRSSAAGGQLLSDGQSNGRFSPTMMDASTSPFTLSVPQTPQAPRMFPPPRPGQDSPATMPSSVLIEYLDFSGSQNLFGLPQSPIPPSPSFASGSSPRL